MYGEFVRGSPLAVVVVHNESYQIDNRFLATDDGKHVFVIYASQVSISWIKLQPHVD